MKALILIVVLVTVSSCTAPLGFVVGPKWVHDGYNQRLLIEHGRQLAKAQNWEAGS